jgi:hypothetical protein
VTTAMDASHQSTSVAQVFSCSPGKQLSKDLAALLRREAFAAVLGSETVDSWEYDWALLENPDVAFSDPRKASLTCQLYSRLKKFSGMLNESSDFNVLLISLFKLRIEILNIDKERLKLCARHYFMQRFPDAVAVDFFPKLSGVQMGFQALVKFSDEDRLKYHLKTHSGGRLETNSSAPKPVDPTELLVYKILEHLRVGSETHFFVYRSLEDVFIATLDASHTDGSRFSTFKRATEIHATCDETITGETMWGSLLSQLNRHTDFAVIEDCIQSDPIAQNYLLQTASLDLISRVFRLQDLLDNSDNFGFFTFRTERPCLKIVDFRVSRDIDMNVISDHFRGFLVGNGFFNYQSSHATLRYALRDRLQAERVKTAHHVLTAGLLENSHDCINRAHQEVRSFFESSVFSTCDDKLVTKTLMALECCVQAFHHNVDFFTSELESWIGASRALL